MNTPPSDDEVRVWLLSTALSADRIEQISTGLPADDQARCRELPDPVVRSEFVLCRLALRQVLSDALARDPRELRFTHGPHGKPALVDGELEFNLSHSDGLAAIALSPRPVGIDVQQQRTGPGLDRMAERYFSAEEASWMRLAPDQEELGRRFSRLWSRKEACLKVTGGRLIPSLVWPLSTYSDGSFGWAEPAVTGRDLDVPTGYHGAVALAGAGPFNLRLAWWQANDLFDSDGAPMAGTSC